MCDLNPALFKKEAEQIEMSLAIASQL